MQRAGQFRRIISVFLSISIIFSIFSASVFAKDNTDESSGEDIEFSNPAEGLLDPSPANLPIVGSDSYLIYDASSDTKLIGYQYDLLRAPAAITQIMTILLALEELELSDTITITKEMYESIPDEYVRIGFTEGEVVTVEQCLYACLLKSANDACMALAITLSGSEKAFVEKMNQRAKSLGCTSTHFTNPYGLADSDHRTTCQDMALIMKEALRHPDFITISTTSSFTIEPTNTYNDRRVLNNANRFVSNPATAYEGYIGGKTGYSAEASYTIIAGANKDGRQLIGILMGASDAEKRYQSLIDLFEYCYANYTTTMVDNAEVKVTAQNSISQIEQALNGSNLSIQSYELKLLDCYSIPTALANSGYSNEIDLSEMVIAPSSEEQVFKLPVMRRFSNDKSYCIGYLKVVISDPAQKAEETEKTEEPVKKETKNKIIPVIVGVCLFIALGFAVFFLIKMIRRRKFLKNHRNPTIL